MKDVKFKTESGNLETGENLKITIEGKSDMPFWHQDLVFKAAIDLLQGIDEKRFFENGENGYEEYNKFVKELEETLSGLKNFY